MKTKTKKIVFRVEDSLHEFIKAFAQRNGMSLSEFIRNVLIYFHTGYLLGEFQKTMPELQEEFLKNFPNTKKEMKQYLKMKKVKSLRKQLTPK